MKKHIIAVEVTGEHIIKGIGGKGYFVDHDHLYIRVQMSDTYNWETLGFIFPKTETGRKAALNRAHYIATNNTNILMNDGLKIPVYENGYGIEFEKR